MNRLIPVLALASVGAAVAHAAPALSTFGPARNRLLPGLSGAGDPRHVALTFDDGPDPAATPLFLDALRERGVTATFFLLGAMAERSPGLAAEIAAAGHEIAVHGWDHRNLLLRGPRATRDGLARARDRIGELTGTEPTLFRPPYGVMTSWAHAAAARLGLRPTLWTSWGEDWTAHATPASVYREVTKDLRGGGTILLHDSDCTAGAAPLAWRRTLRALPSLFDHCDARGLTVGPLRDHGRHP
ncbi:MAG: polysaccharide deacetylase family protein [Actinocrinis sp.]